MARLSTQPVAMTAGVDYHVAATYIFHTNRRLFLMNRNALKFGAHYLPTYVPDLDGPITEFYQRMFTQMEEMDRLGFDHIWLTEHHFAMYGGTVPHPPTFMSAIARTTKRIR